MGTALALLGVLLVLFVAAVLATREGPVLSPAPQDLPDLPLPEGPLRPEDVAAVRFSMAPRGYRMREVDEVLDRLAMELADRDRRLGVLEAEGGSGVPGRPQGVAGRIGSPVAGHDSEDVPVGSSGPEPTARS